MNSTCKGCGEVLMKSSLFYHISRSKKGCKASYGSDFEVMKKDKKAEYDRKRRLEKKEEINESRRSNYSGNRIQINESRRAKGPPLQ